jgi:formyltetrahydrofolate deformylase
MIQMHYFWHNFSKETKAEQESKILGLVAGHEVDLVVLARYMQILTSGFVSAYPDRIINIHHSFLPAFVRADPYKRAHERGVKTIRATAHYVHRGTGRRSDHSPGRRPRYPPRYVEDLVRVGREVERRVLARAVRWHLEDRVLVDRHRIVVFE